MNDDDLRRALDDLAGDLPPSGPLPQRTVQRARRRRAVKLVGSGALAVAVLAGGAGLALTATGGEDRLTPPPAASPGPTTPATPSPSATPSASPSASPSPSPAGARLVLRPDGLELVGGPGGGQVLLLEQAPAATVRQALDAVLGEATENALPDCGQAVQVRVYATLSVTLDAGVLTGWSTARDPQGTLRTADGTGVGTTLAQLRVSAPDVEVTETTIGREFTVPGGPSGNLSGAGEAAEIEGLRAGNACVFR